MPALIYLHGFASGQDSTKARFFHKRCHQAGISMILPDLNVPTFTEMTLTAQLQKVASEMEDLPDQRVVLIGSSMGGLLATLASQRLNQNRQIDKLILLAPGFGIAERWPQLNGMEAMEEWRRSGSKAFFHYGLNQEVALSYSFIEDLARYQTDNLKVDIPTLVLHGKNDAVVPVEKSRQFALNNRDNTRLIELDDDHQLLSSVDTIWQETKSFLRI